MFLLSFCKKTLKFLWVADFTMKEGVEYFYTGVDNAELQVFFRGYSM